MLRRRLMIIETTFFGAMPLRVAKLSLVRTSIVALGNVTKSCLKDQK
jgi:hypothetical protein